MIHKKNSSFKLLKDRRHTIHSNIAVVAASLWQSIAINCKFNFFITNIRD